MRKIKFRAWNKLESIMCYSNEDEDASYWDGVYLSTVDLINSRLRSPYKYIWMQYTGLSDKQGVDIYEGDIVLIVKDKFGENKDEIWAIEYDTSTASFVAFNQLNSIRSIYESYRGVGFNIIDDFSIIEIIGNIYENPELLT